MPSLRGIKISIITQSDFGRLPEYPRPEHSVAARDDQQPSFVPVHDGAEANGSAMLSESKPKVSVYIPSLPGSPSLFSLILSGGLS